MEKEKEVQDLQNEAGLDDMYLKQIEELKTRMDNDMISKAEYDKLKAQHATLLNEYINRRPKEVPKVPKAKKSAAELAQYFNKKHDMTNREYWEKALEYREAFINEVGKDPFDNPNSAFGSPEDVREVVTKVTALLEQYPNDTEFNIKMNTVLTDDRQVLAAFPKRK